MKKTGARWSKDGANGMLATRCNLMNNEFVDFLDWKASLVA